MLGGQQRQQRVVRRKRQRVALALVFNIIIKLSYPILSYPCAARVEVLAFMRYAQQLGELRIDPSFVLLSRLINGLGKELQD